MTREDKLRSFVKAVGYRFLSITATFVVIWIRTGNVVNSIDLTIWTNAAGFIAYYLWERLWSRIGWRRQ